MPSKAMLKAIRFDVQKLHERVFCMKQRARKHAFLILLILTLAGQSHAQNVPLTYQAVTDRNPRPKPALPVLGAAGSIITDPTFGSRILRITDANTEPDH